ncbi:hypothetical protein BDZ91DRAFT_729984 [Kalaharituber pfeilii]|nr:hypothetical protein BDZ91DRAFT_729984 [Kalaharituber pfeilii]
MDSNQTTNPVLDHLLTPAIAFFFLLLLHWANHVLLTSLERASLFTIHFRLTLYRHLWRSFLATICVLVFLRSLADLACILPPSIVVLLLGGLCIGVYTYVGPAWANAAYLGARWAAWSGLSRTAIAPALVEHLPATEEGWEVLARQLRGRVEVHPVERVPTSVFASAALGLRRHGVREDVTDLLIATARAANSGRGHVDVECPSPKEARLPPANTYRPLLSGKSGAGFTRRISRGILSLPRHLLSPYPVLPSGVPAHGLVLAFGVLARNKGLTPASLVCNLTTLPALRVFEEYSAWYPHPAKTLRGYFRAEIESAMGGLGPAYVSAATELALLMADAIAKPTVIREWLAQRLEHQDLALNRRVEVLGATERELDRLYRGSYAAMLVSLNTYRGGVGIRPEMLVFDALCRKEGVPVPQWASGPEMAERRRREVEHCGGQEIVDTLVTAVVG